jgi:hypothetical protein
MRLMQTLLDRLLAAYPPGSELGAAGMALALLVSTAAALAAQLLYETFYDHVETGSQIQRSFLLMGPSVTLLFITVQLSLPLSLGLLGALSIVRFRVPIKEPEEVGFLMVVIASSIACATASYGLLGMLFAIVLLVLTGRRFLGDRLGGRGRHGGMLMLTLDDEAFARHGGGLEGFLASRLGRVRLEHLSARDGRTHLNYAFRGRPGIDWSATRAAIGEHCAPEDVSVLFSRQGGV